MKEIASILTAARQVLMAQPGASGYPVEVNLDVNQPNGFTIRYQNASDILGVGNFISVTTVGIQVVFTVQCDALNSSQIAAADSINSLHNVQLSTEYGAVWQISRDRPYYFTNRDSGGLLWHYIGAFFTAAVQPSSSLLS